MEYPFKDLLPLDEATERTGYYKDWSHIDADTFHQISELVKFIREKGYGTDTREAIAQALERVYHDALQSGNANMEVSMARKNFKDLASRLDASDDKLSSANAQLAQTAKKSEVFLKELGININDFDESTRQTFLEAQGIDVNYVLGTGNVKPINTSFFNRVGNLFDKNKVTSGYLLSSSGESVSSVSYNVSEFISVEVGRKYTFENHRNIAKYDAGENFIEFVDLAAGSNTETLLMDYPLIRTSVHANYLNSARISQVGLDDGGHLRDIIPYNLIEKENYPAFIRYKEGLVPYETDRIYTAIKSISLQGFEIDKTYKLRYIARNNSSNAYRFILAELKEDGTWSDCFDSGGISVTENTGKLTTVESNDNGKSVIMKVAYDLIPNNYADHIEGSGWATTDPFHIINSSGMGGGNSSFNQSLNTTDSPMFEEVTTTGVLPTGTLASPPAGLVTGDTWADTTDSTTHPILRVKL